MKRLARLLRRAADHLDPPRPAPTQELRIKVTAETGAAQEALARLAREMSGLAAATAHATTEQASLAEVVKVTSQRVADARQAIARARRAQEERVLMILEGVTE